MSELRDFLAWFDGFSENIEEAPTAKQWERIKDRVKKLQAPAAPSAAGFPQPGPVPPSGVQPAAPAQPIPMNGDIAKQLEEIKKRGQAQGGGAAMSAGP